MTAAHPEKVIHVWGQDETRLGLQPIVRRVWARKGHRPLTPSHRRYQWLYVAGFVHPSTGHSCWLLVPYVNTQVMGLMLQEFVLQVDPTHQQLLILIVDNAPWHVSAQLQVPDNVVLFPLPPYTPELQPTEPAWPLLREAVANTDVDTLDDLEQTLAERCVWLYNHPEQLKGPIGFHWIFNLKQYAHT